MGVNLTAETDRIYSREEYRQWCEKQASGRFERIDGRIVAMAPERGAHLRVKSAIWLALTTPSQRPIRRSSSAPASNKAHTGRRASDRTNPTFHRA